VSAGRLLTARIPSCLTRTSHLDAAVGTTAERVGRAGVQPLLPARRAACGGGRVGPRLLNFKDSFETPVEFQGPY
jgi:hypothetical protein